MLQLCLRPASTPPFSKCSKILHSVRASNLAWLPPAVHSNCNEWLWLHARTIFGCPGELFWLARGIVLVGWENSSGVEAIQNLPDVHFLFLSFLPAPPPNANTM